MPVLHQAQLGKFPRSLPRLFLTIYVTAGLDIAIYIDFIPGRNTITAIRLYFLSDGSGSESTLCPLQRRSNLMWLSTWQWMTASNKAYSDNHFFPVLSS